MLTAALFEECHRLLAALSGTGEAQSSTPCPHPPDGAPAQADACDLLQHLGYAHRDPATGALRPDGVDPDTAANRLALLAFATRLERVFTLPSRLAPGACFVGGEVAPARFGLAPPDDLVMSAGGRGATLRAAFEGCMGEAAEYLSFVAWGDEAITHASANELYGGDTTAGGAADLPWMLTGLGLNTDDRDRPIGWLTARRFDDHTPVHVPAGLCLRRAAPPDEHATGKAESSGCATGPTLDLACLHALFELVERDAVALWWYGGAPARPLRLAPAREDALHRFVAELRGAVQRRYWCLDVTSDLGIPVVVALSCRDDGGAVITGFGADLDPLAAAQSAVLEMCQMELALDLVHLKIEQRGREALNASDRRHLDRAERMHVDAVRQFRCDAPRRQPDDELQDAPGHGEPLERCIAMLRGAGYNAYWIDLTRPTLNIPAARVLIPGLQSIKPGWVTKRLRHTAAKNHQKDNSWRDLPPLV